MLNVGYAQEIITPPVGVGLAGYFNKRPNQGMYDDLYVKAIVGELNGTRFGFVTFDLCSIVQEIFDGIKAELDKEFGPELFNNLILSATHTHTGPEFRCDPDERTKYALREVIEAAVRAIRRAVMNLLPAELQVASVYNNPYGFVRRYLMKNGTFITNPGWRNPDIDKPETEYDRTISVLAVKQGGRIAAIMCNIANHGDTTGGDMVSADWFGALTHQLQHSLGRGIPVLIVDDASGNINHFDFRQDINQTSPDEAKRIGRGYAAIVLEMLDNLQPVKVESVAIHNSEVVIPHRRLTAEELAEAKHILATVPDIKKEGDFESQDLANKVPAALRYFAQRAIDCHEKSKPSHTCRLTAIEIGKELAFVSLPGEPFNGISSEIRAKSPFKYTFVIELAQSVSNYVPMPECFKHGGYETQPGIDTVAPEAATEIIKAAIANL